MPIDTLFPQKLATQLNEEPTEIGKTLDIIKSGDVVARKDVAYLVTRTPAPFHFSKSPTTSYDSTNPNKVICEAKEGVLSVKIFDSTRRVVEALSEVLTTNRISELRECFECQNDVEKRGPWLFYINNVIFTKKCWEDEVQTNVVEWLNFRTFDTDAVTARPTLCVDDKQLGDINITIDRPCLFGHLYNCEHNFVFADARIPTQADTTSKYPAIVYRKLRATRRCSICETNKPIYQVVGDELTPTDPAFLCNECFSLLHPNYDNDNTFKLFKL
ncbi:hypothetical protein EIN_097890 [Entamoeba invadens IP1]|uniref:snRNA-activating protein complex subunit n=1 Tax=Entamoeba invadens IP1 TaxID=370355 RepID=A0A0A1U0U7_ENTIV|nr:hypothetical protein EIN_097890 [Entamoeba invadens IP1]ELP87502.1 hypothetical protein EIN_097890 [Entamoeba invadens IP1]|eukprot:XP_004254273.1 hypothetical protein EIN_097890 [Entamoeba invadens IP1]